MNIILLSSHHSLWKFPVTKPLGCYQLASWLRQHGYTVKVIDHCSVIPTDTLVKMITKYIDDTTVAIGVSSTFWSASLKKNDDFAEPKWIVDVRNSIEEKFPKIDWLLGGPSAAYPRQLVKDWVRFVGSSEDSLLRYLDQKSHHLFTRKLFDITTSSTVYHESDFLQPHEALGMELSRGCQFKCKFCQYPNIGKKKGTYLRSMECVRNDLLYNYENFGITRYNFLDDTVNEDYDKIVALANIAQSLPFQLEWAGYNRIDLIWSRPETIQILKDSGLRSAHFGIETFHPVASRLIGKGWNGKYAKDFLLELRDHWKTDVTFSMSFIAGLEGDTEESIFKDVDWLLKNKFYSWFYNSLSIKNLQNSDTVFRSEFEKNYADHGYSFPDPDNESYWVSATWNAASAAEVARRCNVLDHRGAYLRIPAAFNIFEITNLGYDMDFVLKTPLGKYDYNERQRRREQFIETYVNKTLSA